MADKPAVTAAQIRAALEVRYPGPEWHVEHELTLEGRRLDFVAFNRWGARSYRTVGFEVKVSQADYRRELEDFRKSEIWTHVVDQFFIVAPGKLIDPDTLPKGWGLLELRGERMFTKVQAAIGSSKTLPRELAARMIDRLHNAVQQAHARFSADKYQLREELRLELRAKLAEEAAAAADQYREKAERYDALMREFGLGGRWDPPARLGELMRFINKKDLLFWIEHLADALDDRQRRDANDMKLLTEARDLIRALRNPS